MGTSNKTEILDGWKGEFTWEHAGPELRPCFCIGPQNGAPACPCAMRGRNKEHDAAWLEGFRVGQKSRDKNV